MTEFFISKMIKFLITHYSVSVAKLVLRKSFHIPGQQMPLFSTQKNEIIKE